ncbi:hypothetical protein HDV05_007496 [Chytridiales sp. JEL 0842]|nr:hypothetical protein HDV05_007496 [Chytridiales sp. JEL 0842]
MQLSNLLLLASLVAGISAQAPRCDKGAVPGFFCLSNCKGNGIYQKASRSLVEGIELVDFKLDFDPASPWSPKATAETINAALWIPPSLASVPMEFTQARSSISVGPAGLGPNGPLIAKLTVPDYTPAYGTSEAKQLKLSLKSVPFEVSNQRGFAAFFRETTLKEGDEPLRMAGYADTRAVVINSGKGNLQKRTAFGKHMSVEALMADESVEVVARVFEDERLNRMLFAANADGSPTNVCLEYVNFDVTSKLIGLGGLKESKVTALPSVIGGNPATGIELSFPLSVFSPSNIQLNANTDVTFDLFFQSQKVGTVIIPNLTLREGENKYIAKSFVHPDETSIPAQLAAKQLLTNFNGGVNTTVQVLNGRSSNMPSLDLAFSSLKLENVLPSSTARLIETSTFKVLDLETAFATIVAYNAFDTEVRILKVVSKLLYKNTVIAVVEDTVAGGFAIPARSTAQSPDLKMKLDVNEVSLEFLQYLDANGRKGFVDIESTLTLSVGGYVVQFDYNQKETATEAILP